MILNLSSIRPSSETHSTVNIYDGSDLFVCMRSIPRCVNVLGFMTDWLCDVRFVKTHIMTILISNVVQNKRRRRKGIG